MDTQRSEKLHNLTMAVIMLAMGYEQVAFAMGAKHTSFPPLYFGVCSVAYGFLLIVAQFEDNDEVKHAADWLSHAIGFLDLATLVALVSVDFAAGLLCSTAAVGIWYTVKHHRNNNANASLVAEANAANANASLVAEANAANANASLVAEANAANANASLVAEANAANANASLVADADADADANASQVAKSNNVDKLNLLLLATLGGAMVFGQIGLALGLEKTRFSPIYFGVSSVSYVVFRVIELMEEDHVTLPGHLSRFAGGMSIIFFVGLISEAFGIAISISAIFIVLRYNCCCRRTNTTPQGLAPEAETLLQPEADDIV